MNKRRCQTAIISLKGAQKRLIEDTTEDFEQKIPFWKIVSTETLTAKFKLVALDNYEFDNQQINNINWIFAHFRSTRFE